LTKAFSQKDVINKVSIQLETKGVCFRITFKWAACMLIGGEFNYTPNADKTATKHSTYRKETLAIYPKKYSSLSKDTDYEEYVSADYRETKTYVDLWGKLFKDKNKTTYSGVSVVDQCKNSIWSLSSFQPDRAYLGIFYGRGSSGAPFGHVVCLAFDCTFDDSMEIVCKPKFFDSNFGEYEFSKDEDIAELIKIFIVGRYSKNGTIDRFNTLTLGWG
jgi:hypothetical protein